MKRNSDLNNFFQVGAETRIPMKHYTNSLKDKATTANWFSNCALLSIKLICYNHVPATMRIWKVETQAIITKMEGPLLNNSGSNLIILTCSRNIPTLQ